MADDEKWGLSREETDKRVRELNQKKKAQGRHGAGFPPGRAGSCSTSGTTYTVTPQRRILKCLCLRLTQVSIHCVF